MLQTKKQLDDVSKKLESNLKEIGISGSSHVIAVWKQEIRMLATGITIILIYHNHCNVLALQFSIRHYALDNDCLCVANKGCVIFRLFDRQFELKCSSVSGNISICIA